MISRVLRPLREAAWHPDDEQLVAFIDAELPARDATRVQRHLGHCWACRSRQRQLEDTVAAFMDACAEVADDDDTLIDPTELPRAAVAALQRRTPDATRRVQSVRRGAVSLLARVMPSAATAVKLGAVCATTVLIVLLSASAPLSARQLVQHVDRAERSVLESARAPVVYQRLEVARRQLPAGRATSGVWDVWTDVDQGRHRSRALSAAGPDVLRSLFAVFERHQMSGGWPVSLRAHQRWRASTAIARETVSVDRSAASGPIVTLDSDAIDPTSHASPNGVVRSVLVVRERDWHPVEQRLVVRDGETTTEFVVRETGFEVVSLASLPVAFFDDRPVPAPTPTPVDTRVEARKPAPLPTASDLVTAEVQAMYALHRFGPTAEDDITVTRHDRFVDVHGLTTTVERRQRLVQALADIRLVRAHIRTTDEAVADMMSSLATSPAGLASPETTKAAGEPSATPTAPAALRLDQARIQADRLPVQALAGLGAADSASPDATASAVARASASDRRADEAAMRRAREAVKQSLALLERAWAWRRLAEWSRRTNATTVTASTHELIELMAREHAEAASRALAALDTTVTPALPASNPKGEGVKLDAESTLAVLSRDRTTRDDAWVDVATDFFGLAAEIDRDTRRLFTASATPTTEAAEEARRLRRGLDHAAEWLEALQQARP